MEKRKYTAPTMENLTLTVDTALMSLDVPKNPDDIGDIIPYAISGWTPWV